MIAKILTKDNREYYSYVFAKFNPGFYETVIVFDEEKDKFELLNVYEVNPYIIRKVFIIDTDTNDWVSKDSIKVSLLFKYKECSGYDWMINDIELIKAIIDGNQVEASYKIKAKELNNNIDKSEWRYVKNQKDAEDLLTAAWGFHDAYIKDIKYFDVEDTEEGTRKVQVLFGGCWSCEIILEFNRDVLIHFVSEDDADNCVYSSNIIFHDGFVYWVGEDVETFSDIEDYLTYFKARSLKWKMINKNNIE